MLKAWLVVFEDLEFEMTSFERHRESLLQPLRQVRASNNMPCLEYYKTIFERFKLKPLYSLNVRAYVDVLLRILQATSN